MAGFNKTIVIAGVKDELERSTHAADKKYDAELAAWNGVRQSIKAARAKVKKLVAELGAPGVSEFDAAVLIHKAAGNRYRSEGYIETAAIEQGPLPQRVRSARERALQNVIDIVESHSEPTVTLSDLRGLGVLDLIKFSENAC